MKKARWETIAPFVCVMLLALGAASAARDAAAAGAAGIDVAVLLDRNTRRCVEELLQEGELASARRRLARFECHDVAVLEREMSEVGDLAVLVEIDRKDRTRLHRRLEEGDLLFDAGDIVPCVRRAEGR